MEATLELLTKLPYVVKFLISVSCDFQFALSFLLHILMPQQQLEILPVTLISMGHLVQIMHILTRYTFHQCSISQTAFHTIEPGLNSGWPK